MNKYKVLRLARAIELAATRPVKKPKWWTAWLSKHKILGFNMATWCSSGRDDMTGHNCSTTACIGGWADSVFPEGHAELELSATQQGTLFYGQPPGVEFIEVTPEHAVKVLRHLAKTKRVDWRVAVQ